MRCDYIYRQVERLVQKYKTRDPIELLEARGVIVKETSQVPKPEGILLCELPDRLYHTQQFPLRWGETDRGRS